MKKLLLSLLIIFCIQLVANAQAAEKITFPRERPKGPMMGGKVAKITFPPTVWTKTPRNQSITILGTTEGGVVLETNTGAKLLVGADNNATPIEATKKWTPVKPIPSGSVVFTLIGTTDDGAQVWAGSDGKSCTLDVAKGAMVDYVGHVTLLK
jgi:hypothetical protein